ncbi:hypothetical protein MINTM007_31560 [Mycobacterium intracellulare]|nr:hypothetical protein MINTM007_31560 [Mycobacterium intracellulare]
MRYIRAPAPPNGHATNRDAVSPARPRSPAPATYNSPTTPAGTGRRHPSSTKSAAPATGDPIAGGPDRARPAVRGGLCDTHMVVSVGPYTLTITRPGAHRSTSSPGHGSAPTTTVTVSKPRGDSIPSADGVWVNTVTRSPMSLARNSSGDRASVSGTTTSRPPCSSAPQISHTEKSNASEWHWLHT